MWFNMRDWSGVHKPFGHVVYVYIPGFAKSKQLGWATRNEWNFSRVISCVTGNAGLPCVEIKNRALVAAFVLDKLKLAACSPEMYNMGEVIIPAWWHCSRFPSAVNYSWRYGLKRFALEFCSFSCNSCQVTWTKQSRARVKCWGEHKCWHSLTTGFEYTGIDRFSVAENSCFWIVEHWAKCETQTDLTD